MDAGDIGGRRAPLERLTGQQQRIAGARPRPTATLRALLDGFTIRDARHITAVEGNTLTLAETQVVLEDGVTIGGETVREHVEVLGVRKASKRGRTPVRPGTPLTEPLVQDMRRVLTKGTLADDAGQYRRVRVYIPGSVDGPPNWRVVPELIAEFAHVYRVRSADARPIRFAARAHVDFVRIRRFSDGWGGAPPTVAPLAGRCPSGGRGSSPHRLRHGLTVRRAPPPTIGSASPAVTRRGR